MAIVGLRRGVKLATMVDITVLFYILGLEAIGVVIALVYIVYSRYIRIILRARILTQQGRTPKVVTELHAKPHIRKFTWDKGTYIRNPKLDSLDSHNNPIGYWYKGESNQIEIGIYKGDKEYDPKTDTGVIGKVDPKALQTELDAKDLQDLTHGERDKIYFIIIGGLVVALVITAIIGFYFYNSQTEKLIKLSTDYAKLIANMTRTDGGVIIK